MAQAMKTQEEKAMATIDTVASISYGTSAMRAYFQTSQKDIPQSQGQLADGTQRALTLLPGYARVTTNTVGDFKLDTFSASEFYVGKVQVKNDAGTAVETTYAQAIVMHDIASNAFVVLPITTLSFQDNVALRVSIKTADKAIPESSGPMVDGTRQAATIRGPYLEMTSGDPAQNFNLGPTSANGHVLYVGTVDVGDSTYNNAAIVRDNMSGEYDMAVLSAETAVAGTVRSLKPQKMDAGNMLGSMRNGNYRLNLSDGELHSFKLVDAAGKTVKQFNNVSNGAVLEMTGVAPGTFFLTDMQNKLAAQKIMR